MNSYDALYSNMKSRFTVEKGGSEYTLGEYMLMKAGKKKAEAPLPVAESSSKGESAVAMIVSYVSDKLTIKKPPVKDKTIRAFPFRASASAFLSAAAACAFFLCFCLVGVRLINNTTPTSDEACITEYAPELEEAVNLDCQA